MEDYQNKPISLTCHSMSYRTVWTRISFGKFSKENHTIGWVYIKRGGFLLQLIAHSTAEQL